MKPVRKETVLPLKNMITDYIIDPMAFICTLKDIPTKFELIWKIVKTLPSGYRLMHIVADTYRETSNKEFRARKMRLSSKSFYKVSKYYVPPKNSQVSTKWLLQNKINRITVWISSVQQRWSATNFRIRQFSLLWW